MPEDLEFLKKLSEDEFGVFDAFPLTRKRLAACAEHLAAAFQVLSDSGCYCECDHNSCEHDDDCERCVGCRIEAALRGQEVSRA